MRAVLRTILLTSMIAPLAVAGLITNGSFEDDPDLTWTIVSNGSLMLNAAYSVEWSSEGAVSFRIERYTGAVTGGDYIGVQQSLNLTGVTGFLFDAQDRGIDTDPIQFLIDGVLVGQFSNNGWPNGQGSGWGNTAQTYDIWIPLADAYNGVHTLTVRYLIQTTHYPADPKIYWIDNIRSVGGEAEMPEPATCLLFALGVPALWLARRVRH
jgi:hypothetical protein